VALALDRVTFLAARRLLPSLVRRDPAAIDAAAIARAPVESDAENTTDAIVAPAPWTAAAGPVGAFVYRAGDTLDSMVGYRDERYRRFGLASARLDDAPAWVPARTTATLVALARPGRAPAVARAVRREARRHPSPNAGVSEAAFAGGLGLRLGGANRYGGVVEDRPIWVRGAGPARGTSPPLSTCRGTSPGCWRGCSSWPARGAPSSVAAAAPLRRDHDPSGSRRRWPGSAGVGDHDRP
jgi:adenosylcobinamide-phosphate synthase